MPAYFERFKLLNFRVFKFYFNSKAKIFQSVIMYYIGTK